MHMNMRIYIRYLFTLVSCITFTYMHIHMHEFDVIIPAAQRTEIVLEIK